MEDDFELPDSVATTSIRIFVAKVWWDSMFYIFFCEIFLELSYDTMISFYLQEIIINVSLCNILTGFPGTSFPAPTSSAYNSKADVPDWNTLAYM